MKFSIKFDGELVRKGLEDLSSEIPKISRQRIRVVMERIKRRMQEYPAERSGQSTAISVAVVGRAYVPTPGRYQRTGNLGSRWAIEEIPQGYKIENTAQRKGREYGRYVVGDAYGTGQAWMHVGRWQVMRDVVEEELEKLPADVEKHINLVARRVGL
jgi:hypothetical protein